MKKDKTKAIIFARVQARGQKEDEYSLDSQIKLLQDYADKKFTVVKIFRVSESTSSKRFRKLLNEMFHYATRNHIPVILCEKIDRLTRNDKATVVVDNWIKKDRKREVRFLKEGLVLNGKTKAPENIVWDMRVAFARFYTNNLSRLKNKRVMSYN